MNRKLIAALLAGLVALGLAALVFFGARADAATDADPDRVRIGVYDNRAVAIAYAASEHNPVREKMAEMKRAKEAGDEDRVAELERWGQTRQRVLHLQGFGRFPVTDLLAHVEDAIPSIAKELDLDAIAWSTDFAGRDVELVDITMELVRLYDPSEKTLKMASGICDHDPIDLAVLLELDPEH
jgi:hypothetical protein